MQLDAIARLRLAFVLLGLLVLGPLAWFLSSVEARLEAQRRLRHEVVAERIFDELERELTSVLVQESTRVQQPDTGSSANAAWPEFVVGYIEPPGSQGPLVTRTANDAVARARLQAAFDLLTARPGSATPAPDDPRARRAPKRRVELSALTGSANVGSAPPPANAVPEQMSPAKASQSEVLKSLNRAHERQEFTR